MKQVMTLSEELVWRGFVHQTTFKDIKEAAKFCQNAYNMKDVPIETITKRINNAIKNNHNYCGRNWKVGVI